MGSKHFIKRVAELECLLGEAYQVIGQLARDCDRFYDPHVVRALDNTSQMEIVHDDVLPFPAKVRSE